MKDHQLALLDRNQYPDRGVGLPVKLMPPADCLATKDQDAAAAAAAGQARVGKSDKASKHADLLQVNECQRVVVLFQFPEASSVVEDWTRTTYQRLLPTSCDV